MSSTKYEFCDAAPARRFLLAEAEFDEIEIHVRSCETCLQKLRLVGGVFAIESYNHRLDEFAAMEISAGRAPTEAELSAAECLEPDESLPLAILAWREAHQTEVTAATTVDATSGTGTIRDTMKRVVDKVACRLKAVDLWRDSAVAYVVGASGRTRVHRQLSDDGLFEASFRVLEERPDGACRYRVAITLERPLRSRVTGYCEIISEVPEHRVDRHEIPLKPDEGSVRGGLVEFNLPSWCRDPELVVYVVQEEHG